MAKNTFKQRSFKDLIKYKRRIPILFENEVVCTMEELTSDKMSELINIIFANMGEAKQSNGVTVLGLDENTICFLLREMIVDLDIKSLSNDEILDTVKELGSEVQQAIVGAIRAFVMSKVEEMLRSVTKQLEENEALESLGEKINEQTSKEQQ